MVFNEKQIEFEKILKENISFIFSNVKNQKNISDIHQIFFMGEILKEDVLIYHLKTLHLKKELFITIMVSLYNSPEKNDFDSFNQIKQILRNNKIKNILE